MNCFNHYNTSAVAQCSDCSKGLCHVCAHNKSIPICFSCNTLRGKYQKRIVMKEIYWTFGFGLFLAWFSHTYLMDASSLRISSNNTLQFLGTYLIAASIISGWMATNKFISKSFSEITCLLIPFILILKIHIVSTIGIFVLPYRTYINIKAEF